MKNSLIINLLCVSVFQSSLTLLISFDLEKVKKHLHTAFNSLENLQSTRTSAMERKLRGVDTLEIEQDSEPLSLPKIEPTK